MSVPEITVQELEALKNAGADVFILDVRNPDEYAIANLGGHLIPINELPMRLDELNKNQHIVVHCQAGGRSKRATEFLLSQGFTHVQNLKGGMNAWLTEIEKKR